MEANEGLPAFCVEGEGAVTGLSMKRFSVRTAVLRVCDAFGLPGPEMWSPPCLFDRAAASGDFSVRYRLIIPQKVQLARKTAIITVKNVTYSCIFLHHLKRYFLIICSHFPALAASQ